jgi:hypothetical protein
MIVQNTHPICLILAFLCVFGGAAIDWRKKSSNMIVMGASLCPRKER